MRNDLMPPATVHGPSHYSIKGGERIVSLPSVGLPAARPRRHGNDARSHWSRCQRWGRPYRPSGMS